MARRMRHYAGGDGAIVEEEAPADKRSLRERFMDFVRQAAKSLKNWKQAERLNLRMMQAGWRLFGSEFLVMTFMAGIIFSLLALLFGGNVLVMLLAFLIGPLVGFVWLDMAIDHRRRDFTNQLGDTLTMVANAMRAGFSFLQAMGLVSTEMEDPMGGEFKKVMNDLNLGMTAEVALQNMARRVGSADFDLVVTAVLIQRQVGGNLAQILDSISNTINDRIRMRREVLTLTAQGRLSGWILAGLPIVIGLILTVIKPDYLDPLFHTPMGNFFVGYAIVSEIVGFLVIQRIIKIDI